MGTDQRVSSTSMLAMHFCQKQHSTKFVLLHKSTFRENSTNEIWKEQGLCWKTDYRLNRIADLPVEALDWDWDEFCFFSEKKIHLHISSCWIKKEVMCPILNLACLFKMQIPENKESDCIGHWKLGQLWARLLCSQPHCSMYQSRQKHLLLFGYCCPTPYILFEETGTNSLEMLRSQPNLFFRSISTEKLKTWWALLGIAGVTEFCREKAVSIF